MSRLQDDKAIERGLNRTMLGKLAVVVVIMFGFGYAMVPLYKKICELTNINVLNTRDEDGGALRNSQVDTSRTITVEFDSNSQGPFRFHPGEISQIVYEVVNKEGRTVEAQAIPSYAPKQATEFFKKIECFCFKQQTLTANESREMPVVFVIDPELPKDVKTITLSYTFFEIHAPSAITPAMPSKGT